MLTVLCDYTAYTLNLLVNANYIKCLFGRMNLTRLYYLCSFSIHSIYMTVHIVTNTNRDKLRNPNRVTNKHIQRQWNPYDNYYFVSISDWSFKLENLNSLYFKATLFSVENIFNVPAYLLLTLVYGYKNANLALLHYFGLFVISFLTFMNRRIATAVDQDRESIL